MSTRLPNFDYTKPFHYMVTLRKEEGVPEWSRVVGDSAKGYLEDTSLTPLLRQVIETFHLQVRCIKPIRPYVIMPDHLHLMLKLRAVEKALSLPRIVWMLKRALEKAVEAHRASLCQLCQSGLPLDHVSNRENVHLFKEEWHDWIVMKTGQLDTFWKYIEENPKRRWVRLQSARYFQKVKEVTFLGRKWYAYGNVALLEAPMIEAFQCSRSWKEGDEQWNQALARAVRLGPGGVGISTFMSPCEKACGRALGKAGGAWIVLSPEGFGERWHPSRRLEPFCAAGRMLFLSLYPAMARQPTKKELYERCHEMGDVVKEKMGAVSAEPC